MSPRFSLVTLPTASGRNCPSLKQGITTEIVGHFVTCSLNLLYGKNNTSSFKEKGLQERHQGFFATTT
jgi:hypothetical protein